MKTFSKKSFIQQTPELSNTWMLKDHNRAGTKEKSLLTVKEQVIQMCLQRVLWGGCLEHLYLLIQAAVIFCRK